MGSSGCRDKIAEFGLPIPAARSRSNLVVETIQNRPYPGKRGEDGEVHRRSFRRMALSVRSR